MEPAPKRRKKVEMKRRPCRAKHETLLHQVLPLFLNADVMGLVLGYFGVSLEPTFFIPTTLGMLVQVGPGMVQSIHCTRLQASRDSLLYGGTGEGSVFVRDAKTKQVEHLRLQIDAASRYCPAKDDDGSVYYLKSNGRVCVETPGRPTREADRRLYFGQGPHQKWDLLLDSYHVYVYTGTGPLHVYDKRTLAKKQSFEVPAHFAMDDQGRIAAAEGRVAFLSPSSARVHVWDARSLHTWTLDVEAKRAVDLCLIGAEVFIITERWIIYQHEIYTGDLLTCWSMAPLTCTSPPSILDGSRYVHNERPSAICTDCDNIYVASQRSGKVYLFQ